MTDTDPGGFHAPSYQRPTPKAVRAAGARLMDFATIIGVSADTPILDMPIPADQPGLRRDQRLMRWFIEQAS
jgi:hypothetical protein